jgi:hypothetical protein
MKTTRITKSALLAPVALFTIGAFLFGAAPFARKSESSIHAPSGTLEKLNVSDGIVTMQLDAVLFSDADPKQTSLEFSVSPGSFFSALVFNGTLRAADSGALQLVPAKGTAAPAALAASLPRLMLEKVPLGERFEYALRDAETGFVYFDVERYSYRYDARTRTLALEDARLLVSPEFARQLGDPRLAEKDAGSIVYSIAMYPIEVSTLHEGESLQTSLPVRSDAPDVGPNPGPDVIIGDIVGLVQSQSGTVNNRVGLAIGTDACNAGQVALSWNANPANTHPVVPQNVYRINGGSDNAERFEQIGQGWMKHTSVALSNNTCGFGCGGGGGSTLGPGCSDPYGTGLNGSQTGIGSRAWINPFTGVFPRNDSATPNNSHTGHTHDVTTHRVLVDANDLTTSLNVGATYFAEAQYVTPHEYAWCQSHTGECNMYNNVSYRRYTVGGASPNFSFTPAAATVRMQPAIMAWTGATTQRFEPAPGADGIGFVGYKVSGPTSGVYHYEYVVYNENLDRAVQSFSVPLGCGAQLANIAFKAPLNHPGIANDGTLNSAGYSNTPWTPVQINTGITWSTETFAQNQNANAVRWGTAYTYRFDSMQPPTQALATLGFFKTGEPIQVAVQAPSAVCAPFQIVSGVSRKSHGAAGEFDVPLNFDGAPAVEPRSGGATNDYTLVFTFSNSLASGNASVTGGTGNVAGSPVISGNTLTVNLTGVTNLQTLNVSLSGLTDQSAQTLPDMPVALKILAGDVNGNSLVSSSDLSAAKAESGNPVSALNFRADVNASGMINATDVSTVKSHSGEGLP